MLDDIMDNEKYTIAQKLYEFYVMNDKYLAVQMPDGRYIPKRIKLQEVPDTIKFL